MSLLANAKVNLLPKEFADKGWRKVLLLIVLNIIIGGAIWIALSRLLPDHTDKALTFCGPLTAFIFGIDSWFVGYNIKQHKKDDSIFAGIITKALADKGLIQVPIQKTDG